MKCVIILAFLGFPYLLSAQLSGTYATTFNGNGHLIIEFGQDSSFTYDFSGRNSGEKGRGEFMIANDTLNLNFIPFMDSGQVDCSFHRIEKDSGQIAERIVIVDTTDKDAKPPRDSMYVSFQLFDCQSGKALEGISIGVVNKKGVYKLGVTDTSGLFVAKLTHDLKKKYRLTINSSDYHERQFDFIFDWNSKLEIFLYQSKVSVLEEGIKRSFLLNSFSNKLLEITPIPTENKNAIYMRRGRNLLKINKQEYKAYQKALGQGKSQKK